MFMENVILIVNEVRQLFMENVILIANEVRQLFMANVILITNEVRHVHGKCYINCQWSKTCSWKMLY